MASVILVNTKEEVANPISLGLLKAPLSTDYRDSSFRAFITQIHMCESWQRGAAARCAHISLQFKNLQPNQCEADTAEKLKATHRTQTRVRKLMTAQALERKITPLYGGQKALLDF